MEEETIPPLFKDPEADKMYEKLVRDVITYKEMKTGLEKFYRWEKKRLKEILKCLPRGSKDRGKSKEDEDFLEDFYKLEKERLKGERELQRIWEKTRKMKIFDKLSKSKIPTGSFTLDELRREGKT